MKLSWLIHANFWLLFAGFDQESFYKSLYATVVICSTLVNIQTRTDSILTSLYGKLSQLS